LDGVFLSLRGGDFSFMKGAGYGLPTGGDR
jgi:hypothetical protein